MAEELGMLDVFGLATPFAAADAGCKSVNVRLDTFYKNKPANADDLPVPLIVRVKFRGHVSAVAAALDAAEARAGSARRCRGEGSSSRGNTGRNREDRSRSCNCYGSRRRWSC